MQPCFDIEIPKRTRATPKVPQDSRPYRPSSGSEGQIFTEEFCERCKKYRFNKKLESRSCPIELKTFAYNTESKYYPKQWVEDLDGSNARCIAFERK